MLRFWRKKTSPDYDPNKDPDFCCKYPEDYPEDAVEQKHQGQAKFDVEQFLATL